jgi:hypothetical protein
MNRTIAAILLYFGLATAALAQATGGPPNQILCNKVAQVTVSSATTTSLVAGVAGKSIFICGWHVTSTQATSTTFQLEYGTQGGPCSSPTVLTPAFSVTSTAPSADHVDYATMQAPVGTQLCTVSTGGTVGQAVLVYYSQF